MAFAETPLTLFGEKTPRAIIYKHESHKLHQSFAVKVTEGVTETILQGQPVKLNSDGTVSKYTGASGEIYLGIAVTDSPTPAYAAQRGWPVEVTVMVQGFCICNWVATAAITPGYVTVDGTYLNNYFPKATQAGSNVVTNFIALNSASAANDVIQVLVK
jgi:hypothetical protein